MSGDIYADSDGAKSSDIEARLKRLEAVVQNIEVTIGWGFAERHHERHGGPATWERCGDPVCIGLRAIHARRREEEGSK